MKKALLLLLLVLAGTTLLAQTTQYNDLVLQAERTHINNKDYAGALAKYQEAFKLQKPFPKDLYNAACSATQSGQKDLGFDFLRQAIEAGWSDEPQMDRDRDLRPLRQDNVRWTEMHTLIQQKMARFRPALARLKALNLPAEQSYKLLVPFCENGLWGVLRRDSLTQVMPAVFDGPIFFGTAAPSRFRGVWNILGLQNGSATPFFPNAPAEALARPFKATAPAPAQGFTLDSVGRLAAKAELYNEFKLVKHVAENGKASYWAVVQVKSSGKWGVINAAGESLSGTRLDFSSLVACTLSDAAQEQVMVYQKANGERGLLDFSSKTHLVKGFDEAVALTRPWPMKAGDRTLLRFKKAGKWGVIGRKPGSNQWVVLLEARYATVEGYGYSFSGAFDDNAPEAYQPQEYFVYVKEGNEAADPVCVDLQGKVYRVKR